MKSGLLWYDPSKEREVHLKCEDAFKRYKEKYGLSPNMAFVCPSGFETLLVEMGNKFMKKPTQQECVLWMGMEIRAKGTIMPNYIWLGRRGEETKVKEQVDDVL